MDVSPGDRIAEKYRVERLLGQGGMGVVVAAVHEQLDQLVALKFLLPKALENPVVVQRFAREARAAAKIQSEHVARVIDVGELPTGAPYMVMEYLKGRDLAEELEARGPLPVADVVRYVLQASEALAEAHAAGIVHRDLKPANLFLAERADGTHAIKVLDFGISKLKDSDDPESGSMSLTQTATVMGSPLYMSPEQMRSARDVDHRGDIWSIGVIAYELLTGEVPFSAENMTELISMVLIDEPKPPRALLPSLPEAVEKAVMRCLAKKPDERYANVAQLAHALAPHGEDPKPLSIARIDAILKRAGMQTNSLPPAFTMLSSKEEGELEAGGATLLASGAVADEPSHDARSSVPGTDEPRSAVAADANRESMPQSMTDSSFVRTSVRPTASVSSPAGGGMRPAYWFGGIAVLVATAVAVTQLGGDESSSSDTMPVAQERTSPPSPATTAAADPNEPEVTPSAVSEPSDSVPTAIASQTAAPAWTAPAPPTAAPPTAAPPPTAPPSPAATPTETAETPPPPPPKNPLDLELK